MIANQKTDVIIVGAGPTGLSLAVQLIRFGVDFVIVDQKEDITTLSKALVVHARSLEIYDQAGLAERAVENGEIVQQVALMHNGKVSAQVDFSGFGGQLSPYPFMLIYEQSKNEQLLDDYLQAHGHQVRWHTELIGFEQNVESVKATLKVASGETQTIEGRYLVGCDGAGSPTRHYLDIPFTGSTHPRLFYVADVEMNLKAERGRLYAMPGQDSFALIVPMRGSQHWRLIGNMPEYNEQVDHEITFDEIEAKVEQLLCRPLGITNVRWFSSYSVHTRHAELFHVGRAFLAGDAAHIHTPAGGQGMNTGIQDAYNLAWKLALVLKGIAPESLLETYSDERLANAKRLVHSTDRFFNVAVSNQWFFKLFREALMPKMASLITRFKTSRELLFQLVSEIGINYRKSSLSQHAGNHSFKVKAGDRMPYFLVEGTNIYDRLYSPKFHLLIFSEGNTNYQDLRSNLQKEYDHLIDFNVIPISQRIIEIFGTNQSFVVLLRPDNHIGMMGQDFSLETIATYFKEYQTTK